MADGTELSGPAAGPVAPGQKRRLMALDVFRGATVAGMLLVNNPGTWSAVYPPLRHAEWHGWTPTDLIFPFFLFIVGVSIALTVEARLEAGEPRGPLLARAGRRAALLVLFGLLLTAFPYHNLDLAHLRLPGVLQRIGICFLAGVLVVACVRRPRAQLGVTAVLLLGYWAAMTLVPVPGHGAGDLGKEGNLGAWLDRTLLGTDHLWRAARTWDPEGLFSSLPATATVLLGVATGRWLRAPVALTRRLRGMGVAGAALVAGGLAWGLVFPINKNLWTSSYVLLTAGLALWTLALLLWAVDGRGWTRWARPLESFGLNAIAIFIGSGVMARVIDLVRVRGVPLKRLIFEELFAPWLPAPAASLAFAVCFLALWMLIGEALRRRRIFLRV